MQIKKIVISPTNTKAIAFFDELDRKKAENFKKIDSLPLLNKLHKKWINNDIHFQLYLRWTLP
jgi:hypothetical protein